VSDDPHAGERQGGNVPRTAGPSPVSTYRLQFGPGFGFTEAAALAPSLARLGITDLYLSPCFRALPESPHGYDLTDHNRLSEALGGDAAWKELQGVLRGLGMGVLLDFVPNHMGVDDPRANAWWWDVLENGNCSPYAEFFDIDWNPVKAELKGRVLLPVLGDQYGRVLERGELRLQYENGSLLLRYFDRTFPINPRKIPVVLRRGIESLEESAPESARHELLSVLTALDNLPSVLETDRERVLERQREKEVARGRLDRLARGVPAVRAHIDASVAAFNGRPGERGSFAALHDLLDQQAYRLAYWRTAFHEINYRRFFDVNGLASLRMENPEVFEIAHRLLLRLVAAREVSGIRLDHIDGLFDPEAYLGRLSAALREALGPDATGDPPIYVVVEKILSSREPLPESWATHGTTGYDFLHEVDGLFVDPQGQRSLLQLFHSFTHRRGRFDRIVYESKKIVMESAMAGELNMLAHALNIISEGDPRSRDFTLNSIREMLLEVVACFPVYRTYVARDPGSEDARVVHEAVSSAIERNPGVDESVFAFFEDVVLDRSGGNLPPAEHARRREFTMKLQQYTAPAQAKGLEDTAFYRYYPLLSRNEVGGAPQRFSVSPSDFHAANAARSRHWPRAMLTTSTHDTKRGEDARTRIDVISEIPGEWRHLVARWARLNAMNRTRLLDGWAPDRGDEYFFYQALVGAWPPGGSADDRAALTARMKSLMIKAVREAKIHTSWVQEDAEYERATANFVDQCLVGRRSSPFVDSFEPFAKRVARLGAVNSLAQVVLKIASPGIADIYQGGELWDLSLADPDNRRPVDFQRRRALLDELMPAVEGALPPMRRGELARELLERWEDGRVKLYVTACGLRLRKALPAPFLEGDYLALDLAGERAPHAVSFARTATSGTAIAVAPRLVATLAGGGPPLGLEAWSDTSIRIPAALGDLEFEDVFTGARVRPTPDGGGAHLKVAGLLTSLPVSLLVARSEA
jgi:(1->4)-alpha-D-glucan 1-alpha-D-glucosylmutase